MRRTFKQVRDAQMEETVSEICRLLKHRYGQEEIADDIYAWFRNERTSVYMTPSALQRLSDRRVLTTSVVSPTGEPK